MERKAAFQMSLGFIIAVVFAIVLLALSLTWLRGMIENIMGITDDLTQEAQSSLRDAFRETSTSFAIWPSQYNLNPGKGLRMSAGIENDAPDSKDHKFVINVIPVSASDQVLSVYGCNDFDTCSVGGTTLRQKMLKWVTFDRTAGLIKINSVGFKFIEVRPDANAPQGTYLFNVVACYECKSDLGGRLTCASEPPSSASCLTNSDYLWGGSAQQLLISVVS
jgi:hypothetical protein